jgi:hypothetical protein
MGPAVVFSGPSVASKGENLTDTHVHCPGRPRQEFAPNNIEHLGEHLRDDLLEELIDGRVRASVTPATSAR